MLYTDSILIVTFTLCFIQRQVTSLLQLLCSKLCSNNAFLFLSKSMRTFFTFTLVTFYYVSVLLFPLVRAQKVRSNGLLKAMNAECIKEGIKVHLHFQKPFHGVAYSYGYYDNIKCRYIEQDSLLSGGTNYSFLIPADDCGTLRHGNVEIENLSSLSNRPERYSNSSKSKWDASNSTTGGNLYIENMLLIQKDASIQEVGDVAQTIRCVFQQEIYKPLVATLPFQSVPRRPTGPPKFVRRHNMSTSTMDGSRVRFESKGQVQSVPYYNAYRKKWSRGLQNDDDDGDDDDDQTDKLLQDKEPEEKILAMALQASPTNGIPNLHGTSRSSHLLITLLINYVLFYVRL